MEKKIAVVGVSCRFPESCNLEAFQELLLKGESAISRGKSRSFQTLEAYAGLLDMDITTYDAQFFGLSRQEVLSMDPQQRILHELVWEAIEDAGINPQELRGTPTSMTAGIWTSDYADVLKKENEGFYRVFMGNSFSSSVARVAQLFGFTGPCVATESACSSSMLAVHYACKVLRNNETYLAFACGVNLLLKPFSSDMESLLLSRDGKCKTFSHDADGYVRSEGCAVLVLKRLSDALSSGDRIWALIDGSAIVQDGLSRALGTPTAESEALVMTNALRDAGVRPEQVSYIEAHGTGTAVGDPIELEAISIAYGGHNRKEPVIVGSVKTNVGHTEGCAGIAGIIKVILALRNECIFKHINFSMLNPAINLEAIPALIPLEPLDWKRCEGRPRIAGVSAFGITGTNAHVIIEEAPVNQSALQTDVMNCFHRKQYYALKVSAKTDEALRALIEAYQKRLQNSPEDEDLCDLVYTANIGRAEFAFRAMLLGKDKGEMLAMLENKTYLKGEVKGKGQPGLVCFLFTGQGSQYGGMAQLLYNTYPVFRTNFESCKDWVKKHYGFDIAVILYSDERQEDNTKTSYSQVGIFCVEYALYKLWGSWGVEPDFVLGHSLGEFCAAVCAGILSLEDALTLVAERSVLVDALPNGKMLVVRGDEKMTKSQMQSFAEHSGYSVEIAAINSEEQTVVAGDCEAVHKFAEFLKANKIGSTKLSSNHAFHSKHMDAILPEYARVVKNISTNQICNIKYISGVTGELIENSDLINPQYWEDHTRKRVNFIKAIKTAFERNCKIFIEIGPQPVLTSLALANASQHIHIKGEKPMYLWSLKRKENDCEVMMTALGNLYISGFALNWREIELKRNQKIVSLPHYPFQRKRFWPKQGENKPENKPTHPLIGAQFPSASLTKIFNAELNLQNLAFLQDHCIGDSVVFPGTGYLEMFLEAAVSSIKGTSVNVFNPLLVKDFNIEAPLKLIHGQNVTIQTLVERERKAGGERLLSVNIYHKTQTQDSWILHSNARVLSGASSLHFTTAETNLVSRFRDNITSYGSSELPKSLYEIMAQRGLRFGPNFKTIRTSWMTPDALYAKLQCSHLSKDDYIVHPILLDAMLQAVLLYQLETIPAPMIKVPVAIGEFVLLARPSSYEEAYFLSVSGQSSDIRVYLLDSDGKLVATMSKVNLVTTNSKTVNAILNQQAGLKQDLWEEVWEAQPDRLHMNPWDLSLLQECIPNSEHFFNELYSKLSNRQEVLNGLKILTFCYALIALQECGLETLQKGTVFDEESLFVKLGIIQNFRKWFAYFLGIFEAEGILQNIVSEHGKWKVLENIPSAANLQRVVDTTLANQLKPYKDRGAVLSLKEVGINLCKILKGEESALAILFPVGTNVPEAKNFYLDFGEITDFPTVANSVISSWLSSYKSTFPHSGHTLRCLEIGAGTGSFTLQVLKALRESGIEFEYSFTDISTKFLKSLNTLPEEFKQYLVFKKLDIEEDPLVQGFVPEYYDLIIAGDVIHATKSLQQTLFNVQLLLKFGGFFHLYEYTKPSQIITFMFGLLDGFWRFEDYELRPIHCFMNETKWQNLLQSSGMPVAATYSFGNNLRALFKCVKKCTLDKLSPRNNAEYHWIVFARENCKLSLAFIEHLEKLQVAGRKYWLVKPSSAFHHSAENGFGLRPDSEEDMQQMFLEVLRKLDGNKEGGYIEGVIYLWSYSTDFFKQEEILQPLFYVAKAMETLQFGNKFPKFTVWTKNAVASKSNMYIHPYNSTIIGLLKSYGNETMGPNCKIVDICISSQSVDLQISKLTLFKEIWNSDKTTEVAFWNNVRHVAHLRRTNETTDKDAPVEFSRFQVILPSSNSIMDLKFGPLETQAMGPDQIEVRVCAIGLNFHDVLSVVEPAVKLDKGNNIGTDFAGIIERVGVNVHRLNIGDAVFGINNHLNFPSHLVVDQDHVLRVPISWTLTEACTIPAVASTCVHSLLTIAKVTKNDRVLIHTATGGMGLCAIQLCRAVGATIICTAGNERKQYFLQNLGIQHVFSSRNTNFAMQVLESTRNEGVSVVLNTLTGEGFKHATLKCCGLNARFVEISKLSIWTVEEVAILRPDISYTTVDMSKFSDTEWSSVLSKVDKLLSKNVIQPIPFVRFKATKICQAMKYLQAARHIGKVVCILPQCVDKDGEMKKLYSLFSDRSTYLITGGFGGIGWEVAKWMIGKGAKHIALTGRQLPSKELQTKIMEINSKFGGNIKAMELNVGDWLQCDQIINHLIAKEFPGLPLRGIMHCAGILQNATIRNHTWDTFCSTFPAKVDGTINLDRATKSLRLEHFVMFSSVASIVGTSGQGNHAAGNYFSDAFTYQRALQGKAATTINFGPWGEVGSATKSDIPGFQPICNKEGLEILEEALCTPTTQILAIGLESIEMASKLLPTLRNRIIEPSHGKEKKTQEFLAGTKVSDSEEFMREYRDLPDIATKTNFIKKAIDFILKKVLKVEMDTKFDENLDFFTFGIDSLMLIEFRNLIKNLFGDHVMASGNLIRENNTILLLSQQLTKIVEGESNLDELVRYPSTEEINKLIAEDSVLDENIRAQPDQFITQIEHIKSVLVTGCTGTFGPYIIYELAKRPQIRKIYCLLRKRGSLKTWDLSRLERILEERKLTSNINLSKLKLVEGNVVAEKLGMSDRIWIKLENEIDAIFHLAANVQHVERYTRHDNVRSVNIGGLKNVLKFCTSGKLKYVYIASSYVAVPGENPQTKRFSEQWPANTDFNGLTNLAYPISKFVGDVIMRQAVLERNIPAKVFRFPIISGDSKTGQFILDQNHVMLRYLFALKTGILPDIPIPMPVLPVDTCAQVSLKIFFNKEASSNIYNVINKRPDLDQGFLAVAKQLGYENVKLTEFTNFQNALMFAPKDEKFGIFKDLYREDGKEVYNNLLPWLRQWEEMGQWEREYFQSDKINRLLPDFYKTNGLGNIPSMQFIYTDLLYAKAKGWLPNAALKATGLTVTEAEKPKLEDSPLENLLSLDKNDQ